MKIPIIGFVGFSGVGKTTLLENLILKIKAKGLSVAVIKHTHHHFDIDKKGKDSFRFRKAGANQVILGSKKRFALMVELEENAPEPSLEALINQLDTNNLDLILVEGFKHEAYAKIEVHRASLGHPLLFPDDAGIVAIATDSDLGDLGIRVLDLGDVFGVLDFVLGLHAR